MKILIIGIGSIGAIHGYILSKHGVSVTHIVKDKSKYQDFISNGIKMDIFDIPSNTQFTALYKARIIDYLDEINDDYEFTIVATNHTQYLNALEMCKNKLKNTCFVMFCANWSGLDNVDKLLKRTQYLWGYSCCSGAFIGNVLFADMQNTFRFGLIDGNDQAKFERFLNIMDSCNMHAELHTNIIHWLWVHHAINAGMFLPALQSGSFKIPEDLDSWMLIVACIKEALIVVKLRRVNINEYEEAQLFLPDVKAAALVFRSRILSMPHWSRIKNHNHAASHPDEMRAFCLDIANTAKLLGYDTVHYKSVELNSIWHDK